jgi:hypothetical protein
MPVRCPSRHPLQPDQFPAAGDPAEMHAYRLLPGWMIGAVGGNIDLSLVLDAASTALARVVWRGVAQTDLEEAPSDTRREAIIRDAVHHLIKRSPFKK